MIKILKILTYVITGLAVTIPILSGVMKFVGGAEITFSLEKVGVLNYRLLLGTMEILFGLLFLFKPTMKIGFILLSCYFAGALATELSHGISFNALLPLIVLWLAAYLRNKSIFLPVTRTMTTKEIAV